MNIMLKDYKVYLAITGGGTEVIGELLRHGGASSYIVGATIPYAQEFFDQFAGKPDKYADLQSACRLATTAFKKCLELKFENALGVGCTASLCRPNYVGELRSDGTHRKHEAHICLHSVNKTIVCSLDFTNNGLTREKEEQITSDIILALMQAVDCCDSDLRHYMKGFDDYISLLQQENPSNLKILRSDELYSKKNTYIDFLSEKDCIIFPGSFNPCTKNHRGIAKAAYEQFGKKVAYEISIFNYSKPPVDYYSLLRRIESLPIGEEYCAGYILSNMPYFVDKVKHIPSMDYIVGSDTWNRIFDFHTGSNDDRENLLNNFYKTHFILCNRKYDKAETELVDIKYTVLNYEDDGWSSTKERLADGS